MKVYIRMQINLIIMQLLIFFLLKNYVLRSISSPRAKLSLVKKNLVPQAYRYLI